MNEQISTYILEKKKEQKSIIDQMLISEGIYIKKTYDPYSNTKAEYDVKTKQYVQKEPIKLTDEEYEQIKVICEETERLRQNCQTKDTDQCNSAIATVLKVVAVLIFIVGFIIGLVLCEATRWKDPTILIVSWVMSLISGLLFLSFAKIINLLNDIKHTR